MKYELTPGYVVDKDGTVYSAHRKRGELVKLSQSLNYNGYLSVKVRKDNKTVRLAVHKLVALYWLGPRPSPHHEIRHLDGDRFNNHVSNLAWGTKAENAQDKVKHGRSTRGQKSPNAKLSEQAAREIQASTAPRKQLAEQFGVSVHTVDDIRTKRRSWTWL